MRFFREKILFLKRIFPFSILISLYQLYLPMVLLYDALKAVDGGTEFDDLNLVIKVEQGADLAVLLITPGSQRGKDRLQKMPCLPWFSICRF